MFLNLLMMSCKGKDNTQVKTSPKSSEKDSIIGLSEKENPVQEKTQPKW